MRAGASAEFNTDEKVTRAVCSTSHPSVNGGFLLQCHVEPDVKSS